MRDYARLPADVRWTGQLQDLLGSRYDVIEEGLNGRTTDLDHADRPGLNGRSYLLPCLLSHNPIDIVVLMLGGNDLKIQFNRPTVDITTAVDGLVTDIKTYAVNRDGATPAIIVISPIPIDDTQPEFAHLNAENFDADSVRKSTQLFDQFRQVADRHGGHVLDAATVASAGPDGTHFDTSSHRNLAQLIANTINQMRTPAPDR